MGTDNPGFEELRSSLPHVLRVLRQTDYTRLAEVALSSVEDIRASDISDIKEWTDESIRDFLVGGNDGDKRDAFVWGDVKRETSRRGLIIDADDSKYDFY